MPHRLKLSDYQILEEFKGNTSNQIYLVKDKSGTKLIFKRIRIRKLESQLREIQAQKALKHGYIVRLLEYEIQPEHIVLLIEYASGGDLFEFINKIESIRESKLLRLFYKIVIAVHFIHLNGFIHRDIKPENVLIEQDSPKLADFGSSVSEETARNTFCGTYEYMAPEIYFRRKQSFKVDIWALGVLLFEMTHNRTPFKGRDVTEIKEVVEKKRIPCYQQISSKVRALVYAMLKFDAKERPTTAQILKLPELKRFYKECKPQLLEIYNDRSIEKIRSLRSQMKRKAAETKREDGGKSVKPKPQKAIIDSKIHNKNTKTIGKKMNTKMYQSNKTAQSFNHLLQKNKSRVDSGLREKTDMNEVLNDSPYTSLEDMCQQIPSPALKTREFVISKNNIDSIGEIEMTFTKNLSKDLRSKSRSKTPRANKPAL